ncbi:hypothetical protein SAMN05421847_1158 [Halpernia humi]|uniref:Uncharacterized protein n=1 Tax=Halpernia humi TaxID=493375 RepID=A0A1H5WC03_9FLAO|nr:hypothetical protein [Halpernia humi]SEF96985.1 hypothetical protein SAMN05421847_1158 [Halpernia humi]
MKNYPLLIPKKIALLISITGFFAIFFGILLKISHWYFGLVTGDILIPFGVILTYSIWFVVLNDLLNNYVKNKNLWLIGMFLFSGAIANFYLYFRESILKDS